MTSNVLAALAAAVSALPADVGLRMSYARQLLIAGRVGEAMEQAQIVLASDRDHMDALALVQDAIAVATASLESASPAPGVPLPSETPSIIEPDIDWRKLEEQVGVDIKPPFIEMVTDGGGDPAQYALDSATEVFRENVQLVDVGGLTQVKQRINEAFLEPMRHPEIAKVFGKSLRGGLMLYGPPGCGKTYLARAIAGELKAHFISLTISDILDKYVGESELNMHLVFERARRMAPAVLFFDELDAVGRRRSSSGQSSSTRNTVNQMLMEMDGVDTSNDGLFVLSATNHPWDVDPALLRPGRFDRTILVLPPDEPAREAILRQHLRGRPVEGINLGEIVAQTEGYSGADLEHICATAGEKAMVDSIRAGEVRPINMKDVRAALKEVKSSIGPWMQSARNVAMHGNNSGQYDELAEYLRLKKLL